MQLSTVGAIGGQAGGEAFRLLQDYFIGPNDTEMGGRLANPMDNWLRGFKDGQGDFQWGKSAGAIRIRNDLGTDGKPNFRAEHSSGVPAIYVSSGQVHEDYRLSCKVFVPDEETYVGIVVRFIDNSNTIVVRLRGATREQVQIQSVIASSYISIDQSTTGTVKAGREHLLELEMIGDTLYTYVDNKLMFAGGTDVSAVGGFGYGFRCEGGYYRDFSIRPFQAIERRYIALDGNDDTGDGSIASPWASTAKANAESAVNNAGFRYCFKAGDVFFGTISPQGSGTGTGWDSCNPIEFDSYGADELEEKAEVGRVLSLSDSWIGPDVNGEFRLTGQTQTQMLLLEDDVRMNGATDSQTTQECIDAGLVPQVGSLQPGEWALDQPANVLYFKPTSLTPGDHLMEICTGVSRACTVDGKSFVHIRNLIFRGSSDQGGLARGENGGAYNWYHNITGKHGIRGLLMGSGTGGHLNYWRQTELDVSSMTWRACSTSNASLSSSSPFGLVAHNWLHHNFNNTADYGDHECIMFGPGDNDCIAEFNSVAVIGFIDTELPPVYTLHPTAIGSDSASRLTIRYNRARRVRLGAYYFSAYTEDINGGHCYNNVAEDCGFDKGNRTRHTIFQVNNRSQNSAHFLRNVVFENNSAIKCDNHHPGSSHTRDGVFVAMGNDGCEITGVVFQNNLISHFVGDLFHQVYTFNTQLQDFEVEINGNVYNRADAKTTACIHRVPGTKDVYDMTHFIGDGETPGFWDADHGFDLVSFLGDLLLTDVDNGDFRPASNSEAKGKGQPVHFTENLDFNLNVRSNDTSGAFEAVAP